MIFEPVASRPPSASSAELCDLHGRFVGRQVEAVPAIAVLRGTRECGAALAADDHWEAAALHRLRETMSASEMHELAVNAGGLLAPQAAHHGDILAHALRAAGELHAQRRELLDQPACPDAEGEAAAGQAVEARGLLRQRERLVLGHETNAGCQPDGLGGARTPRSPSASTDESRMPAASPRHPAWATPTAVPAGRTPEGRTSGASNLAPPKRSPRPAARRMPARHGRFRLPLDRSASRQA